MNAVTFLKRGLFFAVLFAGMAPLSWGQVATSTETQSFRLNPSVDLDTTLNFAPFDPLLGTLQSVSLQFDAERRFSLAFWKTGGSQTTVNYSVQLLNSDFLVDGSSYDLSDVNMSGTSSALINSPTAVSESALYRTTFNSGGDPSAGSGYEVESTTSLSGSAALPLNFDGSVDLVYAPGPGLTDFSLTLSGGNNLSVTPHDLSGDVTLTYTYLIPEPSTYAVILGLSALGLAGFRRSKRRDQSVAA